MKMVRDREQHAQGNVAAELQPQDALCALAGFSAWIHFASIRRARIEHVRHVERTM